MRRKRDELVRVSGGNISPSGRVAVAHSLIHEVTAGARRRDVRTLADLAWGDGALLAVDQDEAGWSWPLMISALGAADEFELGIAIAETASKPSPADPSAVGVLTNSLKGTALYAQGKLREARRETQAISRRPRVFLRTT